MTAKREYDIAFVGLKPGLHEFDYQIGAKFFAEDGLSDFSKCDALVKLKLEKHASFMMLKFDIGGTVEVGCDRCGNNLPLQLWDEFKLVVKLVDNAEEMNVSEEDPDVFYLNRTESHLKIADWIYEFVNLSIPTTRMCEDADIGGPHCNLAALEKLKALQPEDDNSKTIWKGLDKFKDLKSN